MKRVWVTNIEEAVYEAFVQQHPKSHFSQSYAYGQLKQQHGYQAHYVGLMENEQLVATALLLEKRLFRLFTYFYIPRGMMVDYDNTELLTQFTQGIAAYCKQHKAVFFKMDPDLALREIDEDAKEIVSTNNRYALLDTLASLGYQHQGFGRDFEYANPRFTFRLDLTQDEATIHKNLHATTRKILNRSPQCRVYRGSEADMEAFCNLMHETANRANFTSSGDAYYRDFYNVLGKPGYTDLYFASVNLKECMQQTQEKIAVLENEILQAKKETKKKEFMTQCEKAKKDVERYLELAKTQEEIILTSIITVKYGDKAWTVHGGNNDVLREMNGNYYVYYQIIKDMKARGCRWIDFFGTTGNPDPSNPIYGIYLFKKRLGGTYIEFIGEFDYVFHKPLYLLYTKAAPALRKLLKSIKS